MAKYGLLQNSFEDSIYSFTLKFKDIEMEESYMALKSSMKMLTSSSRCFLFVVVIGFFAITLLDMSSALTSNPEYKFAASVWVVYSTIFLAFAVEFICFFCDRLSNYRGIMITIIGCLVLVYNSFSVNYQKIFYPFIGIEYF